MNQLDRIEAKQDQIIKLLGSLCNAKSDTPIAETASGPAERYGYVSSEPWCQALLLAHCKVKRENWQVWKAMYDKHGDKLASLAQMLEADKRWPDKVAVYIDNIEKRNTNAGKLRELLLSCGCTLAGESFDQWRGMLNKNCTSTAEALECVRWITDAAKRNGKPIVWATDATPWIQTWLARQ